MLKADVQIASTEEGKKILDAWLETSFKAPCPASDGCPWNNEIEQFLDASIQEMEMISQAALENADVGVTGDEKSISTSPATPPTSVVLLNSLLETMSHAPSPSIYDSPSESIPRDFYGFLCGIVMVYSILFHDFCGCIFRPGVCRCL